MLPSKRGFNLCKALFFSLASFRVPLKRVLKLKRLLTDFRPDGIPTTTSHLTDLHGFFLLAFQNIQFICEVNSPLNGIGIRNWNLPAPRHTPYHWATTARKK
ncbi:hypothetical protein AVEN_253127-1 [Araneus ventricosus]|uniref:Uncharacterized protein n=1 Tax=Araneus ventricosus TaxID=182803 RepID=A0A4Y2HEG5_ARAVE|nr:hypothetical protein AVEN_253127-1 [Araneus ventricosus]